jgi:hypothetical protein
MTGQAVATGGKAPLNDVMLAMDVVDTLRHRNKQVEKELSQGGRDEALKQRLRKIYAAQGIEVPDRVIEEGVAALKEDRFVYQPPRESLQIKLARLYIARDRWGKWVTASIAIVIIAVLAYFLLIYGPRAALPSKLESMRDEVNQLAKVEPARASANELYADAQTALRDDKPKQARASLSALTALRDQLEQSYTLDIVTRPDELSGVWRTAKDPSIRNYYLIVEATDASGAPVKVAITNEEDGAIKQLSKWGIRVDKSVYQQVGRDQHDDGIIQGKRFGVKHRGYLDPEYSYPTSGSAITQW